ncbi:hypothetical protein HNP73_000165 [Amaricoccus macauensis]|uniref:Reverse transcriptase domain-containing protein n=1 Tax=Amaricoccus macauensis TaxID=57001 RepID=A0A840SH44_9RHOB|nr:antiviral reverse transcriptase Drt2 [Amaricoccus macauensis]MBB5220244.1 hypothetical protein [Amaricoccus macauensis]
MPGFYLPSENEFDPSTDDFVAPFICKERRYRHFDLPLRDIERNISIDFSREVRPHRFLPLLGFTEEKRRIKKIGRKAALQSIKKRAIRYASHNDAAYLQAYSAYLSTYYEHALKNDGLSECILAYRKDGGTNIHHAKALFDEIRSRRDCFVVALDISGFFDSLEHSRLRDEIARLLDVGRLTGHDATVWKNVTRYSWVETTDLDLILGRRRNRGGRICSPSDFADHVRGRKSGLIRTHDLPYGIPQGTPISGLYANIFLRSFDQKLKSLCDRHYGSYRRYSDDIAIILPLDATVRYEVAEVVEKMLADVGLALSIDKSESAEFRDGRLASEKPIQYLGFTFDGKETLIRQSSLDAYRGKMRRGIHAKLIAASRKRIPSPEVFKRQSLSRYTHLGKRRNFLRYAYRAADIIGSDGIRQQVKRHPTWFKRAWERGVVRVYGDVVISPSVGQS